MPERGSSELQVLSSAIVILSRGRMAKDVSLLGKT